MRVKIIAPKTVVRIKQDVSELRGIGSHRVAKEGCYRCLRPFRQTAADVTASRQVPGSRQEDASPWAWTRRCRFAQERGLISQPQSFWTLECLSLVLLSDVSPKLDFAHGNQ